jgi:hypothetical protein
MILALWTAAALASDLDSTPAPTDGALVVEESVLAYDVVGFAPAAPEQPAMGPDLLAAGGNGRLAAWDPVHHRVLVVDGLKTVGAFPVDGVDDLAVTAAGDVVMEVGRTLILVDGSGAELARTEIPGIVPIQASLRIEGDALVAVDAFDNLHNVARIDGHAFAPAVGPALVEPAVAASTPPSMSPADAAAIARVDGGWSIVETIVAARKDAIKVSARQLGKWMIVERVVADHPIAVERFAAIGGQQVALPVAGRAYVPARDLAVDAEGRLVVFDPEADGLHVVRISR